MIRLGCNIAVLGSVLFLPWWITALSFVFVAILTNVPEIVLYGLFADILYGTSLVSFFPIPLLFTAFTIVVYFLAEVLKQHLSWYRQ